MYSTGQARAVVMCAAHPRTAPACCALAAIVLASTGLDGFIRIDYFFDTIRPDR
jgi:hypothetical protein